MILQARYRDLANRHYERPRDWTVECMTFKVEDYTEEEQFSAVPPNEFVCPLTMELMKDPVVLTDGFTYEREAITHWLQTSNRSPRTNLALDSTTVIQNMAIKIQIREWKDAHRVQA